MSSKTLQQLSVGEELPELVVPLSRTLIVATAIASRDYQDVHHDPELARLRGSEDIFMNILTSNGFAERYVRDWAGASATITRIALRLGVPNYAGDEMVCTGKVLEHSSEHNSAVIAVTFTNSRGVHARGTVDVTW